MREALSLSRVHILGQSWGTMLAVDYALTQPGGLVSLILASPALSIRRWTQDARRLLSELPEDSLATLDAHEREGFTSCPECRAALIDFYRRYICRMRPWPESLERSFAGANQAVYQAMWGPTEFNVTGCCPLTNERTACRRSRFPRSSHAAALARRRPTLLPGTIACCPVPRSEYSKRARTRLTWRSRRSTWS